LRRVVEEVLVRVLEQGFAGFASPDKQRCLIEGFKTEDLSTDTKDVLTKRDSGGLRQTERERESGRREENPTEQSPQAVMTISTEALCTVSPGH